MVEEKYTDVDKEIMYWIDYFGYKWVDCGQLIDYIKDNYTKTQQEIVEEYVEVMEVKVPSIYILDWDAIVDNDEDYVSFEEDSYLDLYLNIYKLEHEENVLRKEGLIE